MSTKTLSGLIQSYFTIALPQRGLSPLTILSYRDALKLLLRFASNAKRRHLVHLEIGDVDAEVVRAFLDHLQAERGNEVATRNNRLAAIRSFFSFVGAEELSLLDHSRRVCAVPLKRGPTKTVSYLEDAEVQALIAAPDTSRVSGLRDHALLLFLYNTGARVQETTEVRAADLRLERPRQVLLHGKGRKDRIVPLWAETGRTLSELLEVTGTEPGSDRRIFLNAQGESLTRFGIDYLVKKYGLAAASKVPSITRKRLSPHTLRHTFAVHALNSGVDINTLRALLGHVDLRTTNIYAEINLETKRKAIESCAPQHSRRGRRASWKQTPDLLDWLEQM